MTRATIRDSLPGVPPGGRAFVASLVAWAVVIAAPLVAGAVSSGTPASLRLPVETILLLLLVLALPDGMPQRIVAYAFGAVCVVAAVIALLDLAFVATIDRGFAPTEDWRAVINAYNVVRDVAGHVNAALVAVIVLGLATAAVVVIARCALRCGGMLSHSRPRAPIAVTAAAVTWIALALAGAQHPTAVPLAAADVATTLQSAAVQSVQSIRDRDTFAQALREDPLRSRPAEELLTGLRGTDVVVAFVESYGEVAVSGTGPMAGIERVIDEYATRLTQSGYRAESAFLTSPTFGGESWLAHGTLQSGMWVDSQQKYDTLLSSDRMTLSRLFGEAAWRTVAVNPAHTAPWPEGAALYGYDRMLDERSLDFRGPAFGFARVPDQFTWQRFFDEELSRSGTPIMAEVDLVSSHTPWTPNPRLVSWSDLGDGSIFDGEDKASADVWPDEQRVRAAYAEAIEYSLGATLSFLETYDPPHLVLVLVGDHQPSRIVSGPGADSDVPITIVSKDAAVFEQIEQWGWDAGFRPSPDAPAWRMDAFRDRFVAAFSG
ncbi:CDP-alcohol phosphatidyltransferase [Microbacterium lacus]|uniref:CDP-alcohol phosphatidyltransferase n=1 Tax=Microbacterium lacus TaxID=415217 RepID=UPI00384BCC05